MGFLAVEFRRYRLCYLAVCLGQGRQFFKNGLFGQDIVFLIQALFRICIANAFLLGIALVRLFDRANNQVFAYFLK